jgi:hypothetical protein
MVLKALKDFDFIILFFTPQIVYYTDYCYDPTPKTPNQRKGRTVK